MGQDYMKFNLLFGTLVGQYVVYQDFVEWMAHRGPDDVYVWNSNQTVDQILGGHAIIIVGYGVNGMDVPYWEI